MGYLCDRIYQQRQSWVSHRVLWRQRREEGRGGRGGEGREGERQRKKEGERGYSLVPLLLRALILS